MSEEQLPGGGPNSATAPVCPWCSADLPNDAVERCPSCGAALHELPTSEVPGVTRIDHEALLKGRPTTQKSRGLIGWLSGEYEAEAETTTPGTLEPPDEAVRREMLRLELVALEAEVHARQVEAVAEIAESGEDITGLLEAIEGGDAPSPTEPTETIAAAADPGDAGEGAGDADTAADAPEAADAGPAVEGESAGDGDEDHAEA